MPAVCHQPKVSTYFRAEWRGCGVLWGPLWSDCLAIESTRHSFALENPLLRLIFFQVTERQIAEAWRCWMHGLGSMPSLYVLTSTTDCTSSLCTTCHSQNVYPRHQALRGRCSSTPRSRLRDLVHLRCEPCSHAIETSDPRLTKEATLAPHRPQTLHLHHLTRSPAYLEGDPAAEWRVSKLLEHLAMRLPSCPCLGRLDSRWDRTFKGQSKMEREGKAFAVGRL